MPASFRTFSSPGGQTVNGVAYLFDTDSGIFRPVYKSDLASNLNISGGSLSLDSTTTNALLSGISGQLTTNVGTAAWVTGTVSYPSNGSVSNDAVSGVSQAVLPNTPARKGWFIQNLHTGGLMVRYSSSLPTISSLNMILKGGVSINDGAGASYSEIPAVYTGPVSVSGLGGSAVSYIAWQV